MTRWSHYLMIAISIGYTVMAFGLSDATRWQRKTYADIHATLKAIKHHHIGWQLKDPKLFYWIADLEQDAMRLATLANNPTRWQQTINAIINTLNDPSIRINQRWHAPRQWAGFTLNYQHNAWTVQNVIPSHPSHQPQLGWQLLSCDGHDLMYWIHKTRHFLPNASQDSNQKLVNDIFKPTIDGLDPRPLFCTFGHDGMSHELRLHYQPISLAMQPQTQMFSSRKKLNKYVTWIHLQGDLASQEHHIFSWIQAIKIKQRHDVLHTQWIILDTRKFKTQISVNTTQWIKHFIDPDLSADFAHMLEYQQERWRIINLDDGDNAMIWPKVMAKNIRKAAKNGHRVIFEYQTPMPITKSAENRLASMQKQARIRIALIVDPQCNLGCAQLTSAISQIPGTISFGHAPWQNSRYHAWRQIEINHAFSLTLPTAAWLGNNNDRRLHISLNISDPKAIATLLTSL